MRKRYFKILMAVCMFATAVSASAIVPPAGDNLEDGATYLLQNVNTRSMWLGHTSWDGAICYEFGTSENFVTFKSVKQDDGTWSFIEQNVEGDPKYLVIVPNYVNLFCKVIGECPDTETTPRFKVVNVSDGVYRLIADAGNWAGTIGFDVLMNAGNTYPICPFYDSNVYQSGDIYHGFLTDPETGERLMDDEGNYFLADSTTCHWNFVNVEHYQEYMGRAAAYTSITAFENNFVNNENINPDFHDGFAATLEAVTAIYESEEYDYTLDNPTIISIVNAKVNLYNTILEAIAANVTEDAVLKSATDAAKKAFDSVTDLVGTESALKALNAALKNYREGTGDFTAAIQNPSFEDLSSQNGNQTTGVEGAPTGWNVYVNGNQIVTADDAKNAGLTAWHGINNDADGEAMAGNYIFGIWNGSIPRYEISQKIDGLENGSYIVSAGLMAGANGSGSRMTTQRIFANLNSTYFGFAEEYNSDELDKTEVYGFQGNDQYYVTDRTLFPMQVRAYVYDGTLTLGLRTDGNVAAANRTSLNSAGGDGWFKLDNFRLQYLGYIPEDAFGIFQHFFTELRELYEYTEFMNADLRASLDEKMEAYKAISTESDIETINKAIFEVRELIVVVSENVKAYNKLSEAIARAWEQFELYQDYPGADEFADVIYEVEDGYASGVYTTEQCAEAIKRLEDALQACIESNVVEPGKDITNRIKNPSFEDTSAQGKDESGGVEAAPAGWNLVLNGVACATQAEVQAQTQGWCAINHGDALTDTYDEEGNEWTHQYTDGDHLWGIWSGAVPVVEISQTVGLPAGTYKLSADVIVQNDWAGFNLSTQRLFADGFVTMFGSEEYYETYLPEDAQAARQHDIWNGEKDVKYLTFANNYRDASYSYSSIPYTTSVIFGTEGNEPVRIGFRTDRIDPATGENREQASFGWFKLDNFRLECINLDVPDAIESVGGEQPLSSGNMFNLAGQKVSDSFRGIVISNGRKQIRK
ncbi:MAG: hypothetical protein MJY59_00520 [Bacteroidaceae bacterium]|nr:hypothetical protein [Bacteroidaceae bacterium]